MGHVLATLRNVTMSLSWSRGLIFVTISVISNIMRTFEYGCDYCAISITDYCAIGTLNSSLEEKSHTENAKAK